jgi:putative metallohydrolase (TIGR04338 family)
MSRTRDSQKQRLYAAEQYVRIFHDIPIGDGSMPAVERVKLVEKFIKQVCKRKYIIRKYGKGAYGCTPPSVRLSYGNAYRFARAYGTHTIEMPRSGSWAYTQLVALHELAHIFESRQRRERAAHGWEFAAIFLDLVRNVMGRTAHDALKAAFKEHKVRYKPKGKRTLTPEQREAARARMEKARAVRAEKLARRAKLIDMHKREPMTMTHKVGPLTVDKHPERMTNEEIDEVYRRLDKYEQDRKRAAIPPVPQDPFGYDVNIDRIRQEMMFEFMKPVPAKIITGITS